MESMDDESSDSCADTRIPYFRLLNTLANDLDSVLNDLYTTPPSTLRMSGDAFLEPYMQGLSNDVNLGSVDEVFDGSSNVFKKRVPTEDYPCANEDRASSVSSPVNSLDTPLDERTESHFRLIEVHAGSQGSLNQLISGDDECSEASSEGSSLVGDEETSCDITLVERLVRSHPIWFLPGIQRAGAFHLLQGKEDGNFIVRQSSHNSTMAISVRLPYGKGPYIEHYLIQGHEDGQLGLESSDNKFTSIPLLIAHYCQCCDELPVQLTLPRTIREAKNRQQLTSFALLGQEFWRYPMANPKQEDKSPSPLSPKDANPPLQNTSFLSSSSSHSPASSLSSFESSSNNINNSSSALEQTGLGFDTDPNTPMDESLSHANSLMSTFKSSPTFSSVPYNQIGIPVSSESPSSLPVETSQPQPLSIRRPRPTPPCTLNLSLTASSAVAKSSVADKTSPSQMPVTTPINKTPPPPPPRWTKPALSSAQSFTVTTTDVNSKGSTSSSDGKTTQVSSSTTEKIEKHITTSQLMHGGGVGGAAALTSSLPTIAPTPLPRSHVPSVKSPTSPLSQCSQVLSPVSEGNTRPFSRRHRRSKESIHYKQSDVLLDAYSAGGLTVDKSSSSDILLDYNRPIAGDKASDYEDIWANDNSLTTFKPQPLPRSTPFTSFDDSSVRKAPTKKASFVSLTPDIPERSLVSVPSPVIASTPEPSAGTPPIKSESPPSIVCTSPTGNVAVPQTPTSTEQKSFDVFQSEQKLGSPFYAEPADAIKQEAMLRRRTKPSVFVPPSMNSKRHSDPAAFNQWLPVLAGNGGLERIDSKEELITKGNFSTSVDNLDRLKKKERNGAPLKNIKPVEPPKAILLKSKGNNAPWIVDSSWEFIAKDTKEEDVTSSSYDDHKLVNREQPEPTDSESSSTRVQTFQDIIFKRLPNLRLSPVFNNAPSNRLSANAEETADKRLSLDSTNNNSSINDSNNNSNSSAEKIYLNGLSHLSQISDNSDDTQTIFSEPWDSTQWEHLLTPTGPMPDDNLGPVNRCKSFKERLDPLLSPPRLKALAKTRAASSAPGAAVRAYAFKLAADKSTVFAQNIDNFIFCTMESRETKPQIVMRNMRQFMSGMKNYLVTHGEGEFNKEVESECNKLKSTEFLNLDAILEGVMHKLVITPLKEHLSQLFVKEYEGNGAIQILVDNIRYARTKPACDLGVRDRIILPTCDDLTKISEQFQNLQMADSPLEKLEFLLSAIATIFHSVKEASDKPEMILGADDFLPVFVWVLVQTGMVAAEVEAEFMWGLLHPSLLSGEGGYYLTTLSSAVNVLKNFRRCDGDLLPSMSWRSDQLAEFKCVLKVLVPNELNGSLLTKTLPVRPNMTTRDICKIIALKMRITNPQDYSLLKLVDGEETILKEEDCPQDVKSEVAKVGKHCVFAYKRIDAKIAWPRTNANQQQKFR